MLFWLAHLNEAQDELLTQHAGCKFQQLTFWNIFLITQQTDFDISCKLSSKLQRRKFAWTIIPHFLGKNKKNIMNLLSADFANKVVKIELVITFCPAAVVWSVCASIHTFKWLSDFHLVW